MINIGIIGLGFMAATHIRAYRQVPGAKIAALCNPSGRNLDGDFSQVSGNVGATDPVRLDMAGVTAYRDLEAFLSDPTLDAIDICAPTPAHRSLALAALAHGKHVLCEKPLARTVDEARAIVDATAKSDKFFMPAMCIRFWPEWRWARECIQQRRFGRVLAARFRRVAEPPGWGRQNFFNGTASGGALFDLHIHDTDFVQACFGKPRSVYSTGYARFSNAVDHVVTQYQVESGAIVHAEGAWTMAAGFGFNMSFTINFEEATLDYDIARGPEALRVCRSGQEPEFVKPEGTDGYVGELSHFVQSLTDGRPPSVVTAGDALAAVEICAAEERSVAEGRVVSLS